MHRLLPLLLCLSLQAQPDPFCSFITNRLVGYNDDPGSGYAREDYQWVLKNTGQDSLLFLNGVYQSSEPGGTASVRATQALSYQPNANGIIVGIVDSGCNEQADFAGTIIGGHGFYGRTQTESTNYADYDGHGTFVASIIASQRGNGRDIAGLASGCKLLAVSTDYWNWTIANGIRWCVDNGATVISLSWGESGQPDTDILTACSYAALHNVIIVTGVANSGENLDGEFTTYPYAWNLPNVIEVCGSTREDKLWPPSARGTNCVAAPARLVLGVGWDGLVEYSSGNSFASPIVASLVALMQAYWPGAPFETIVKCVKDGCAHPFTGIIGRVDFYESLHKLHAAIKNQ